MKYMYTNAYYRLLRFLLVYLWAEFFTDYTNSYELN